MPLSSSSPPRFPNSPTQKSRINGDLFSCRLNDVESADNKDDDDDNDDNNDSSSFSIPYQPPRFVQRNLAFYQSKNRVQVTNINRWKDLFHLAKHDWFHVLLRYPTSFSLTTLLAIWTSMILVFAGIYVAIDNRNPEIPCGLGLEKNEPIQFGAAFAFSLETCTTVGYGLPSGSNAYFENCPELQVFIYFQMTWSMMFNAFLFAFFYARLAKCDARGAQVIISDKAIVSLVDLPDGTQQVRFQIRLYDVDSRYPIVESHVRLYAVLKDRPVPRPLRLLQPDDELGGMLFLSVPSVATHHIDRYSLLHPPTPPVPDDKIVGPILTPSSGLGLRQVDGPTSNRDECICPICGESYGTLQRWIQHVKFQQLVETKDEYPVENTHLSIPQEALKLENPYITPTTDIQELQDYFENYVSEIICVVEGIEPTTSGTFQSLQSYMIQDIVFDPNACFRPCVQAVMSSTTTTTTNTKQEQSQSQQSKKNSSSSRKQQPSNEKLVVDLDRFHGIDIKNQTTGLFMNRSHHTISAASVSALLEDSCEASHSNNTKKQNGSIQEQQQQSNKSSTTSSSSKKKQQRLKYSTRPKHVTQRSLRHADSFFIVEEPEAEEDNNEKD